MKSTSQLLEKINTEISELRFGDHPVNLYEPIRYLMGLGGKRLRPLLVLLSHQLFKEELGKVLRPALAVEVFHNFTLMHDDIMDEAPLRRGQPTVHEKWDQTVAILSGDTMLVKAYDLLLEIPKDSISDAVRLFNKTAVEVCEGQQIDMNFENEDHVSIEAYIEMIRLKTAVLLGFSMQLGGILAGVSPEVQTSLYSIGESMGVGFQLMDDYLDVYADKSKFGKQVGGDIVSNKKTFLLITALESAGVRKKELEVWLKDDTKDTQSKVQAVTEIYNQLGIPELTKKMMNDYFDTSFKELEKLDGVATGAKEELLDFAHKLMKRQR